MGRWKDIFANEGPDIHVAIIADKLDALIIDKGELSGLDGRNWTTESQTEPWQIGHRGFGISADEKRSTTSELESMEGLNGIHGQMRGGKRSRTSTSIIHTL